MKKCLYLDDIRTPLTIIEGFEPWYVVKDYNQFVSWINLNGLPDIISFDHDLSTEHSKDYFAQVESKGIQNPNYDSYLEKTGYDCAKWLCNEYLFNNPDLILKQCYVHSHNPVGAKNIVTYINNYKRFKGLPEDCIEKRIKFTIYL